MFYNRYNYFSKNCYDVSGGGSTAVNCDINNNYIKLYNLDSTIYSNLTGSLV